MIVNRIYLLFLWVVDLVVRFFCQRVTTQLQLTNVSHHMNIKTSVAESCFLPGRAKDLSASVYFYDINFAFVGYN